MPTDARPAASLHHWLGVLAHARGDYDTAETRYQQAVQIFERLGDQAGMATTYAALGMLHAVTGAHREAIRYELQALAIRLRLGSPDAATTSSAC